MKKFLKSLAFQTEVYFISGMAFMQQTGASIDNVFLSMYVIECLKEKDDADA